MSTNRYTCIFAPQIHKWLFLSDHCRGSLFTTHFETFLRFSKESAGKHEISIYPLQPHALAHFRAGWGRGAHYFSGNVMSFERKLRLLDTSHLSPLCSPSPAPLFTQEVEGVEQRTNVLLEQVSQWFGDFEFSLMKLSSGADSDRVYYENGNFLCISFAQVFLVKWNVLSSGCPLIRVLFDPIHCSAPNDLEI